MNKLDENKVYSLEDLTSDELQEIYNVTFKPQHRYKYLYYWEGNPTFANEDELFNEVTNAKELFYTLENVQVDCSKLTQKQINKIADVFEKEGCEIGTLFSFEEQCFIRKNVGKYCLVGKKHDDKTIITYGEFMRLFGESQYEVKMIVEAPKEVFNPQPHYDNSKGSLYKVATERNWNAYLFDIVKRLERGGKKDPLEQEIQKSIDVLILWQKEINNESNNN